MAPRRKKIKDMKAEEAAKLTDDEAIETLFGRRVLKELRKETGKDEKGKS